MSAPTGNQEQWTDEQTGQFKAGNQFWKQRATHGAPRKYTDPNDLFEDCKSYFEWVDQNPFMVWANTKAGLIQIPRIRPYTIGSLCLYLGITHETWTKWRKDRSDLSDVINVCEAIIYEQKFAGAASDQLNANIIARDLKLADTKDHTSSDGSMSPPKSWRELAGEDK